MASVDLLMIFTNAVQNSNLQSQFVLCMCSLLHHTTPIVNVHLIADIDSHQLALRLLEQRVRPNVRSEQYDLLQVHQHDIKSMISRIDGLLGDTLLQYFRHSTNSYYGHNLFFLSLIADKLFPDLDRVIQLDVDLKFKVDIAQLWRQFELFNGDTIVGIAHEQQPVYKNVFSSYKSRNPDSVLGEPPPSGVTGFNSGVLLLHLHNMRLSSLYQHLLTVSAIERLASKYSFKGHLGDQDVFTLLSADYPDLFHVLPCAWNRQLCTWWRDHGRFSDELFQKYHFCPEPIYIYHGNCATPIPNDADDDVYLNQKNTKIEL